MNKLFAISILLCTGGSIFVGQEPEIDSEFLPRIQPTSPEDALSTFEISPGFQLKMAAHEPDVVDPIAMAFDEDGGLFVIEMRGYSERREEALGRIRYLQDHDNDGRFETSTIFKDHLKWPTGIVCYRGGVFVGASPDVWYFKDTNEDGISDEEKRVFTGFGNDKPELNMQALFNSFRWGPDNRIWGATAASGGKVNRPDRTNSEFIDLRGADFSFDPELLDLRQENGTEQYGMSFDSLGRRFVCSNSQHAVWVAYERSQVLPNPYYELPPALVDIPDDGAAAPVFRISPDEPWRIVRTRWRVSGVVRGMIEGGGRVSGYFTSASGIHLYWGDAYGEDFENNLFVGDVGSNLVHRKILHHPGSKVQPVATRPENEQETEFLRSHDNWFRPASFVTGPDGCLYICDMYREVIEHPWSLPQGIKKHLDLNSGFDRGRIYRVEPIGFQRSDIPKLSQATNAELLELAQRSGNDWSQTTARRLLYERGSPVPQKTPVSPFPATLQSQSSLINRLPEWLGDRWKEAAVLNSLRTKESLLEAWNHSSVAGAPHIEISLANMIGRTGDRSLHESIADQISSRPFSNHTVSLINAMKVGMESITSNWQIIEKRLTSKGTFKKARTLASDRNADTNERLTALRLIQLKSDNTHNQLFQNLVLEPGASELLILEASKGIRDTSFLLTHFGRLPKSAQSIALRQIFKTTEGALAFLHAIEVETIPLESIPAEDLELLRNHTDPTISQRVDQVLPELESRKDVLEQYQQALQLQGSGVAGGDVFKRVCIQCHQSHDGQGVVFGPPTLTFKTAGKASILGNILDPNREVAPQYQAFKFTLKNGETYVGMIAREDGRSVTLALPGGLEKTFLRSTVDSTEGLGYSLMPEGLEQSLTVKEIADLLAYLTE